MRRLIAVVALTAALVGPPERATAQEPEPVTESGLTAAELDDLTARVADQLRCPVCRNQSVLESPTELAREMQAVIRDRLAAGETPEQVKAYFVGRYGEWILLKPEPRGANLVVYLVPALLVVGGGLLVVRKLTGWAGREQAAETAPTAGPVEADDEIAPELSEKDEAWLERAIRGD